MQKKKKLIKQKNNLHIIFYKKFTLFKVLPIMEITKQIQALYDTIPRRYNPENVKQIYESVESYEDVLIKIEAINTFYEKNISTYFDIATEAKALIKKSSDNKLSKQQKDNFFDQGSGLLKENMQELLLFYDNGNKK